MWGRAVILSALALGCAGAPPAPPTAVIDVTPSTLCAPDDFTTEIALSGARSATRLSLVPTPPDPTAPLAFEWRIEGAAHVLLTGSLSDRELTLLSAGDRPLHAWLTVRDEDGGEAVSSASIAVIETQLGCEGGCPRGMECSGALCVPAGACAADGDCGLCFRCDAGRCAARPDP